MWKSLVGLLGLGNIGFGLIALLDPPRVASWLGLELLGVSAYGELRAVYGGLVLALGGAMIWGVFGNQPSWLAPLALLFGGLVSGRLISLSLDGWSTYTLAAAILEAAGALLLAKVSSSRDGPLPE